MTVGILHGGLTFVVRGHHLELSWYSTTGEVLEAASWVEVLGKEGTVCRSRKASLRKKADGRRIQKS